jgi:hypothetical protein
MMRIPIRVLAISFVLLFATLQTARADSVNIIADQTMVNLTAGQSLVVTYTVTISASGTDPGDSVQVFSPVVNSQLNPSGDVSDLLVVGTVIDTCNGLYSPMNNGTPSNMCTDVVTYLPGPDTGMGNSGSATADFSLTFDDTEMPQDQNENSADTIYTVNNPGTTGTGVPEPSILPLIGSGLFALGFARVFRRS